MPSEVVRRVSPEEEELALKRAELARLEAQLAEHELLLASLGGEHQIAYLFMSGNGTPERPPPESESYFRKYAESGNPCAQWALGKMFEFGINVSKDHLNAGRWYLRAAKQNYAYAQCSLGEMYSQGRGVAEDYALAAY